MNHSEPTAEPFGNDRVMSINDVKAEMGFRCEETASKFMKRSGYAFKTHGRVFILESSFWRYLHDLEGAC